MATLEQDESAPRYIELASNEKYRYKVDIHEFIHYYEKFALEKYQREMNCDLSQVVNYEPDGMAEFYDHIYRLITIYAHYSVETVLYLWYRMYAEDRIATFDEFETKFLPAYIHHKRHIDKEMEINKELMLHKLKGWTLQKLFDELLDVITRNEFTLFSELHNQKEQEYYETNQAELIHDGQIWKIVNVLDADAWYFFGRGTKWRIGDDCSPFLDMGCGPLCLLFNKVTLKKFQIDIGISINDQDNVTIEYFDFINQYPETISLLTNYANKHNVLWFNQEPSDELCRRMLDNGCDFLQYIINQTEDICFYSIGQNAAALYYVHDQTYELCIAAVPQNKYLINAIRDPEMKNKIQTRLGINPDDYKVTRLDYLPIGVMESY